MKIRIEQAIEIQVGLSSLDGYDRVVKDGERERVVRELYQLGGGLRLAIAKNINTLKPLLQAHQDARNALLREHAGGSHSIKAGSAEAAAFAEAERALLMEEEELPLIPLAEGELKLEQNPVPGGVLALLMPILQL